MARAELDVGELLLKLIARETGEISKVDYHPQKPSFNHDSVIGETHLERATPESQGVCSAFFAELIKKLGDDKDSNIHKIMFLRHGKIIADCAYGPYDMDMWHVSYSMCKSIVGMAIGILIDEGKLTLDEKLSDIFSTKMSPFGFLRKNVTVKHLLDMSSGVEFSEAGALSGNDWRKGFLEASFKFDPGTSFEYNSMNTYMLSAIITEKTGLSCFDYCRQKIFEPMGIYRIFWESCPQSITKGGWGLFIRMEDMAKLGQLYLQHGMWDGRQIVPESWVKESTSWQIQTEREGNNHYGYQLWINDDREGSYAFNGMLGQNVFVYPDIDMVVVTNGGNKEVFQTSKMALTIRDYMKNKIEVSDRALTENSAAYRALLSVCQIKEGRNTVFVPLAGGWRNKRPSMTLGSTYRKTYHFLNRKEAVRKNDKVLVKKCLDLIDGRTYNLEDMGAGIFPILMQVVHNNFTDGIHKLGFRRDEHGDFYIDIYEGIEKYPLKCAFNGSRHTDRINMHGEIYEISISSICTTDEYGRFVIRNEIAFLEEACTRIINIYMQRCENGLFTAPEKIEIRMSETPGTAMLFEAIGNMAPDAFSGLQGKLASALFKGGIKEAIIHAVRNTIQPVITGVLSVPDYPVIDEKDLSANVNGPVDEESSDYKDRED